MKEINNVLLTRARNAEHYQFHYNTNGVITAEFAEAQKIADLLTAYTDLFAVEDKAYAQSRGLADTKEVEAKDAVRDNWLRYVFQTIESKRISPYDDEKAAAERLRVKISPYWNCHTKPYAENTADVTNMVDEMLSDDNKADTELLALTDTVNQLKQANEDFDLVYTSRSSEKQRRDAADNMKTIRPKVDAAYRELVQAINALYTVNALVTKDEATETAIGSVIDSVNAIILQFTETLSIRTARAASKKNNTTTAAELKNEEEEEKE